MRSLVRCKATTPLKFNSKRPWKGTGPQKDIPSSSNHHCSGAILIFLGKYRMSNCSVETTRLIFWELCEVKFQCWSLGKLLNAWVEIDVFFPFSIVPVVSRSISLSMYLSYLILSYPIHRSCPLPPQKKKLPRPSATNGIPLPPCARPPLSIEVVRFVPPCLRF